ncbi:MAG: hypothetical protein ACLFTZ_02735 [Acholeplasmataceae bacterium]
MDYRQRNRSSLDKSELLAVLRIGFTTSFSGGFLIASFTLVTTYQFDFQFYWIFFILLARYLASRIQDSYEEKHDLYPILSVFFWLLAFYLMFSTYYLGILYASDLFVSENIRFALDPVRHFRFLWPLQSGYFSVNNLLEVLLFVLNVVLAYRFAK